MGCRILAFLDPVFGRHISAFTRISSSEAFKHVMLGNADGNFLKMWNYCVYHFWILDLLNVGSFDFFIFETLEC